MVSKKSKKMVSKKSKKMVSKKSKKMVSKKSKKMVSKKSKKTSRGNIINNMADRYYGFILQKLNSLQYHNSKQYIMELLQERDIDYAKDEINNFVILRLETNNEFNNQHYSSETKDEIYEILTHKIYINLTNY
jgi:hypothetical protein